MTTPFTIHTDSSGSFPYRWRVTLRQRVEHPNGVVETRTLLNAKGWGRTSEAQERRVQAAMQECRLLVSTLEDTRAETGS